MPSVPWRIRTGFTGTTIRRRSDDLSHHVVLLKERVVEVVAGALSILRFEDTTMDAAVAALGAN